MKTETASWTNESFLEDAGGKLVVFFHAQQVPHNHRTKIENRPVFVEKIFITKNLQTIIHAQKKRKQSCSIYFWLIKISN